MSLDTPLDRLALFAGIVPEFIDLGGILQPTSRETKLALLAACGWDVSNDALIREALKQYEAQKAEQLLPDEMIIVSGHPFSRGLPKAAHWHLYLEGSDEITLQGRSKDRLSLSALPSGIHSLIVEFADHKQKIRLIAAPQVAPSVADLTGKAKHWGVNLALYGLHSERNKAIGDYADLGQICTHIAGEKASFVGINPVHAIGWHSGDVISPYSPSHRGFLNTNPIAVERIAPASDHSRSMIAKWRMMVPMPALIDYTAHAAHIRPILVSLYQDFCALASAEDKEALDNFRAEGGEALQNFARFEHLAGLHGTDWRQWPEALKNPLSMGEAAHNDLEFHIWLQWHAEKQLAGAQNKARSAGMPLGLYLDLAVGARRDGAEAWGEQGSLAHGVSIGAPPDHLSPAGQNWNLAAYAPNKLAAHDYRAFRTVLARNMRHCGVLRIDHVLGLNRSFWIPDNGARGGYIKHNFEALLAIVRIEAERNRTSIIGEDLGLVPDGFRQSLFESGIYSYSVLQYEKEPNGVFRSPADFQPKTLACFGTHDTPSLAGFAAGRDIEWWKQLGWTDAKGEKQAKKQRRADCKALRALSTVARRPLDSLVHQALAESPVEIVAVQLDDIEAKIEAQNLPGTIDEHPNWRRRSSSPVESFAHHKNLQKLGRQMRKHRN